MSILELGGDIQQVLGNKELSDKEKLSEIEILVIEAMVAE